LLSATINSIYAAEDLGQAAHFLTRGLSAVFGVVDARVWCVLPHENSLRLAGHLGPRPNGGQWTSPEIPIGADRLESRAFRQGRAIRGREGERHVWRAIPLLIPGRKAIGVVTVCDDLQSDQFLEQRERDLQLLGYLNQAARAVEAVITRRQELALAGRMQAGLLPAAPLGVAGWQLAAAFRPARETAGDFYDFIPLAGRRLGLVVADVADKGMGAALYMALSRTLIRTFAADFPERPDLALHKANERILADTRQAGLFVTVFYGILDPETGLLTYCNAGHHPPFLILPPSAPGEAADSAIEVLPGGGMALGVVADPGWQPATVQLDPGAALMLYTDGVVDAQGPGQERFGIGPLLEVVGANRHRSAHELQDALLARMQQFVGDEPQFDDITLMVVRREVQGG
jgi:serine phosphatase RsbU (regulator of sigma subunit)